VGRQQPVVKVRRRTEAGDAPGWGPQRGCHAGDPWQGVTTENRGPRRACFARWGGNIGNIWGRSNAARHWVPNPAAALGWRRDAAPAECSGTFTTPLNEAEGFLHGGTRSQHPTEFELLLDLLSSATAGRSRSERGGRARNRPEPPGQLIADVFRRCSRKCLRR